MLSSLFDRYDCFIAELVTLLDLDYSLFSVLECNHAEVHYFS